MLLPQAGRRKKTHNDGRANSGVGTRNSGDGSARNTGDVTTRSE